MLNDKCQNLMKRFLHAQQSQTDNHNLRKEMLQPIKSKFWENWVVSKLLKSQIWFFKQHSLNSEIKC